MAILTASPRPVKTGRTVRLMVPFGSSRFALAMVNDNGKIKIYELEKEPSDEGDGFAVRHEEDFKDVEYHTSIADGGCHCTCKAMFYRKVAECRHIGMLKALRDSGKI
jgi:hypothetical protein